MHAWEQIDLVIQYIEDHLSESIELKTLAETACLSPFYFQRLFNRLVKTSVQDYIKRRRLAWGAQRLIDYPNERILDVAIASGFSSHEVFTRTFRVAFGVTPDDYRANPIRLNHFNKPTLVLNYTLVDENVPLITDGIVLEISTRVLEEAEHFVGLSIEDKITEMPTGKESNADEVLGVLWDKFHEKKETISELYADGDEVGVMMSGSSDEMYKYFVGAQAKTNSKTYENWELPKGEYIVCMFEAENFEQLIMNTIYKAHQYLYGVWLPKHNISIAHFAVERYHNHNPEATSMAIWLKKQ